MLKYTPWCGDGLADLCLASHLSPPLGESRRHKTNTERIIGKSNYEPVRITPPQRRVQTNPTLVKNITTTWLQISSHAKKVAASDCPPKRRNTQTSALPRIASNSVARSVGRWAATMHFCHALLPRGNAVRWINVSIAIATVTTMNGTTHPLACSLRPRFNTLRGEDEQGEERKRWSCLLRTP